MSRLYGILDRFIPGSWGASGVRVAQLLGDAPPDRAEHERSSVSSRDRASITVITAIPTSSSLDNILHPIVHFVVETKTEIYSHSKPYY